MTRTTTTLAGMLATTLAAALACASPTVSAQGKAAGTHGLDCGDVFLAKIGPWDYRTSTQERRNLVELYHFTAAVETLKSGVSGTLGSDIDYTLRAFPNHPRALTAIVRLAQRDRKPMPTGAGYTAECYLERATQFAPDDMAVRQIRGVFYAQAKRYDEAVADLQAVVDQQPNNASAHYNLGLALIEKRDFEGARAAAKRAAELGYPLEGLKKRLQAAGQWTE